ncbi:AAA family ATPase [Capnocytophaga sp.]|uniref:AAA family ATPase n=1 Tax=Capnocytophaga sp. TaxID=44737 RepID=UPI0026DD7E62|nr:AAA family ATPase [Capnocytophaga sp.]MDO5104569.1 AAA family ATPase [Capnocytophaga sp.]
MCSRIRIKHFGGIKEGYRDNDSWIDIEKVTAFIGNQGSGKSTVAKLVSTFTWLEKALHRGDYNIKYFTQRNRFTKILLPYHRLENYLIKEKNEIISEIEYEGKSFDIQFKKGALEVNAKTSQSYSLPQIMYVPAERNFIAYVKNTKELKLSSDSLQDFLSEFNKAKENIKGFISLPINDTNLQYDKLNDILSVKGGDYKVRLSEASSGFQSVVPLYIVSEYLAKSIQEKESYQSQIMSIEERERFQKDIQNIYKNEDLTEEQRRIAISALASRFNKTSFINIVEEPEQNLFPSSQEKMLESLVAFNNYNEHNKLIITTHSPYLINHIGLLVKAGNLYDAGSFDKKEIEKIIPEKASIKNKQVAIYQFNEKDGTITRLPDYNGIPDDDDFLNEKLAESNDNFAELLDIQQKASRCK